MRIALILAVILLGGLAARAEEPRHEGRTASQWAADLPSQDLGARRKASYALWQLGPAAAPAAAPLARALQDEDEYVRTTCAKVLLRLAAKAGPAAPIVAEAVASEARDVHDLAVEVLVVIDPVSAVAHAHRDARLAAIVAHVDDGPRAPEGFFAALGPRLEDEDAEVRSMAAAAVGNAYAFDGAGAPALAAAKAGLIARLVGTATNDAAAVMRERSLYALGWLGRHADAEAYEAVLPAVLAATGDKEPAVRGAALQALRALGKRDARAQAAVLEAGQDREAGNRALATLTLVTVAVPDEAARRAFVLALDDADRNRRAYAAAGVGILGDLAAPAVPKLIACYEGHEDRRTRRAVADALGRIGPAARAAAPLVARAYAASPEPAEETAFAHLRLSGPAAEGALDRLVAIAVSDVGGRAMYYLGLLGEAAAPAVPKLVSVLEAGTTLERVHAAESLGGMGTVAASARSALERAQASPEPRLAAAARSALEALKPGDAED